MSCLCLMLNPSLDCSRNVCVVVNVCERSISCCVVHMWKEISTGSPDPTVRGFWRVHVWKWLYVHAALTSQDVFNHLYKQTWDMCTVTCSRLPPSPEVMSEQRCCNITKDFLKEWSRGNGLVNIPRETSFKDVINDREHCVWHLRLANIHQQELTTPLEMASRKHSPLL